MSQNDYVIGNQTASNFRADLSNALQALASLSSGSTAPSTTYANMLWYDTGNNLLKMRTEADDAWINIAYLDQSANAFRLLDDTQVTDTSGTQTGLLGDQATSAWETGTATTESLVSPTKVKAAIEALAPQGGVTHLGDLSTASGATVTLSGLDLTDYKFLDLTFDEVSFTNSDEITLEGVTLGKISDQNQPIIVRGGLRIDLGTGGVWQNTRGGNGWPLGAYPTSSTNITTATTSVSLDTVFTNSFLRRFNGGQIKFYGVK